MIAGNLPNILTITRILLLPFFAAMLIYGNYQYALILFIAAAITDILDGFIARIKKQMTDFGAILDPVADKFLLITSFILMSMNASQWIPKWLTIIVISKDLIVVTGWLILYFVTSNLKVVPSALGKVTSSLQFTLIGAALLSININGISCSIKSGYCIPLPLLILVAVLTAASGLQYVYRGLKIANKETD